MPPKISEIVGKTLRSPHSAAVFGISDPEAIKPFSRLRVLDDPLEMPKVEELMGVCDELEASLLAGEFNSSRLLNALLNEALEPSASAA